ncbi:MAG: hypothetical protein Fur0010_08570 [Bdellovibrio sp.]
MKLLLISILIFVNSALADGGLKFVRGKVIRDNKLMKTGDRVQFGDKISVAAKSLAVVELDDGSKIKINELSQVIIKKNVWPEAEVTLGSVFFNIVKRKTKDNGVKFKVKARQVSLGVRGTEFYVSLGKMNDDVWMCVNEGLVEAATEKKTVLVKQGEGIHVKKDLVSDPKPLAWTKKLNWNMNENSGDLENNVSIEEAYTDVLGRDYD